MLNEQEVLGVVKTFTFPFVTQSDSLQITESSNSSINPFDTGFIQEIIFSNNLYCGIDKKDGKYIVYFGRYSGWVGGISYNERKISFLLDELTIKEFEIMLDKAQSMC